MELVSDFNYTQLIRFYDPLRIIQYHNVNYEGTNYRISIYYVTLSKNYFIILMALERLINIFVFVVLFLIILGTSYRQNTYSPNVYVWPADFCTLTCRLIKSPDYAAASPGIIKLPVMSFLLSLSSHYPAPPCSPPLPHYTSI